MTVELRRLEAMVKEIHQEMVTLRGREEEMRNINEATNARVAWFSIGSLVVCISLAGWQLWSVADQKTFTASHQSTVQFCMTSVWL